MNKSLSLVFLFMLFRFVVTAQIDGSIDSTFNSIGIFTYDFGFQDNINDVKIQPDQKIVLTGVALDNTFTGSLKVVRLLADGSLDSTFGVNGIVTFVNNLETYGYESYIRSDGKILVAGITSTILGYYDMLLIRLNTDGSLDSTFGINGVTGADLSVRDDLANAIAEQADGKILLAGSTLDTNSYRNIPTVIRFTENGIIDSTFGTNGIVQIPVVEVDNELTSIIVQPGGKIIAAGHYESTFYNFDVLMFRMDSTGSLDASFGTNGIVITTLSNRIEDCYGMDQDTNGNIILCGLSTLTDNTMDMLLLKYDSTGTPVSSFGNSGIVTFNNDVQDVAYDVKIQNDNKIILTGTSGGFFFDPRSFATWRYLPDGQADSTFGTIGFVTTAVDSFFQEANSIAIQQDGKIVVAGKAYNGNQNDVAVVRYTNSFSSSIAEVSTEKKSLIYPNPILTGTILKIENEFIVNNKVKIEIIDLAGNKIFQTILNGRLKTWELSIPPGLSLGIYFIRINNGQKIQTKKLVVQ